MIILDTNVVSEFFKPGPDERVLDWFNAQNTEKLYLTSINVTELLFWAAKQPDGKRKRNLQQAIEKVLGIYGRRVLPFDYSAARRHANLAVIARKLGKGFPEADSYIAAIAAANNFSVATRDVSVFEAVKVNVINPWEHTVKRTLQ